MVDNCRHVNKITPSADHSILNPQKWLCCECGTTESVWACLSCSHVACGRYIEEHALKHYEETKHPISLEVNEKYAYCYECGDYILNDNRAGDLKILRNALSAVALQSFEGLEKRGRRILRSQSYSSLDKGFERRLREQDRNTTILWFRRYYLIAKAFSAWKQSTPSIKKKLDKESAKLKKQQEKEDAKKRRSLPTRSETSRPSTSRSLSPSKRKGPFTPGITGLRNLGNTCYMNSVLQVLRHLLSCSHLRQFRQFYLESQDGEAETPVSQQQQPQPTTSSAAAAAAGTSGAQKASVNGGKRGRPKKFARQTTMECFQHVSESGKKRAGLNGGGSSSPSKKKLKLSTVTTADVATIDKNTVSLCKELHALLRVMWSGKWALVSPHKMLSAVWQIIPFFKGYSQQDAQEFLCEFLDKLSSDNYMLSSSTTPLSSVPGSPTSSPSKSTLSITTTPSKTSPSKTVPSTSTTPTTPKSAAVNNNSHTQPTTLRRSLRRSVSSASSSTATKDGTKTDQPDLESMGSQIKDMVTNMFQGELVSEVTCQECGYKSRTKEPFTDLSLEFPDRYHYRGGGTKISYESCHVEEMLAKFTEKEKLEGKIYGCEQCNNNQMNKAGTSSQQSTVYTEVEKQFMIQNLPHVLRLHLKRFMWSGRNHRGKISIHVDFANEIDMRPYCHPDTQAPSFMYNLNAIVMHHGRGFGSGHYTAYCWNEDADSWIHCNDAKLLQISIDDVMKAQAYILFYTQKPVQIGKELSPKQLPLFDEEADEDITFNFQNSAIPRFVELKRRLSNDHSGRMRLKKRKSTVW